MNKWIAQLADKLQQESHLVIGVMSGTSLDGIDLAACEFWMEGDLLRHELLAFESLPFAAELDERLKTVCYQTEVDLEEVTKLNVDFGTFIAESITAMLMMQNIDSEDVDLIASHGQTLFHVPDRTTTDEPHHATLQIGDGDVIAVQTGRPVISDFRMHEVANGREGAPLAPYAESLLLHAEEPVALVNIGGISNVTVLRADGSFQATDCGPGNTLMDAYMRHVSDGAVTYDEDGWMAQKGEYHDGLLKGLFKHPFYERLYPKSTGQEEFSVEWLLDELDGLEIPLSQEDVMATLAQFTARSIRRAIEALIDEIPGRVLVSGGGSHNPVVMGMLRSLLRSANVTTTETVGLPVDAKEAILFAALGYHSVWGKDDRIPRLGKLSWPNG
jgi:anhydro-N-acetylmuramic acid kinase